MKCKLCDLEMRSDAVNSVQFLCPTSPSKPWSSNRISHYYVFNNSEIIFIGSFRLMTYNSKKTEIMDYEFYYKNKGIKIDLPLQLNFSDFKNCSEAELLKKIKIYQLYK